MRKLLFIALVTLLVSCAKQGDYQYLIYMQDGSVEKAWSITPDGGGLTVLPPMGQHHSYYLSSTQYKRAVYVGLKNNNE